MGVGEGHGAHAVEFVFAVLLQGLANHLGGEARLHVAQAFNGLVAVFELGFVLVFERAFGQLLFKLGAVYVVDERVALLFNGAHGLGQRQLPGGVHAFDLGLEALDLGVFGAQGLLQLVLLLGLREFGRGVLVLARLGQLGGQGVAFFFNAAQRLRHGQLLGHLAGV